MAPGRERASLEDVYTLVLQRLREASPTDSYVARLAAAGPDAVLKKVGEECTEVLLAAKGGDRAAMVHELADLHFHLLVWMADAGITPADVERELGARFGRSGLERPRPNAAPPPEDAR